MENMKKYAFLLMGECFTPEEHQAEFKVGNSINSILTVRNKVEAKEMVIRLHREGYGAIEVCGAFGEEFTRELIDITDNQVAIGYSVNFPFQDRLFKEFFS